MKRVLIVVNTLGGAGAENALVTLLKKVNPEEYEIELLVLGEQGELRDSLPEYVKLLNRKYYPESVLTKSGKRNFIRRLLVRGVISGAIWRFFGYAFRFRRTSPDVLARRLLADAAIRTKNTYDLAIAYMEGGAAYYVANYVEADCKKAVVHVDYKQAGYARELEDDCYLSFSEVFAVSEDVKNAMLLEYPELKERIFTLQNVLDVEEIRRCAKDRNVLWSNEKFHVLTVARLHRQKALEVSIRVMKRLKDAGFPMQWHVLGEGEEREYLEELIAKLDLSEDFILEGAVTNPYPYYVACDLYVHATKFEGKSIAVQEAQILGCPMILSDCSGNREQIATPEEGMLVAFTEEAIAQAMIKCYKEEKLRKRFSAAVLAKWNSQENGEETVRRMFKG